jgi:hypothetical protein
MGLMARLVDWLRRRAQRPGPQGEVRPGFRPQHDDDDDEIPGLDLRLAEFVRDRIEQSDGAWRVLDEVDGHWRELRDDECDRIAQTRGYTIRAALALGGEDLMAKLQILHSDVERLVRERRDEGIQRQYEQTERQWDAAEDALRREKGRAPDDGPME